MLVPERRSRPEPPARPSAQLPWWISPGTTPLCRSDAERGTIRVGGTRNQCTYASADSDRQIKLCATSSRGPWCSDYPTLQGANTHTIRLVKSQPGYATVGGTQSAYARIAYFATLYPMSLRDSPNMRAASACTPLARSMARSSRPLSSRVISSRRSTVPGRVSIHSRIPVAFSGVADLLISMGRSLAAIASLRDRI